jgi:hypothetical protein
MHADVPNGLDRHWLASNPEAVQARHLRSSAFICGWNFFTAWLAAKARALAIPQARIFSRG